MKSTLEAYKLFHNGSKVLAQIESNGMRVDEAYLDEAIAKVDKRIKKLQERMRESKVFDLWRKEFGGKTNMGSRPQLAKILFDVMKIPYKHDFTAKAGRYKTDESVFETLKEPFVRWFVRVEKLKKLKTTYLIGLRDEVVDGFVHPVFNLHTVETMRSSCDSPNVQNIPSRQPEFGEIIRRCFIPREEHVLVEVDYGQLEFRIAACVWKDKLMIEYASDPSKDIHRDMAADLFLCDRKLISKQMRYVGKNGFVFPILYGSYYVQCSRNIWEEIQGLKMEDDGSHKNGKSMMDGRSVIKHLAEMGITKLGTCDHQIPPKEGTFEWHVKKVEDRFNSRFSTFAQKKEEWIADYRKRGGFPLLTGFWIEGDFSRNFLLNCPIQGSAFHCLLWSLIRIQREVTKERMGMGKLIAEIHDSIIADVLRVKLQDYLNLAKRVMTKDVRKKWPWIVVPLGIEVEIGEQNWFQKVLWIEKDGKWQPKN